MKSFYRGTVFGENAILEFLWRGIVKGGVQLGGFDLVEEFLKPFDVCVRHWIGGGEDRREGREQENRETGY